MAVVILLARERAWVVYTLLVKLRDGQSETDQTQHIYILPSFRVITRRLASYCVQNKESVGNTKCDEAGAGDIEGQ